jgi:hypothetical protein
MKGLTAEEYQMLVDVRLLDQGVYELVPASEHDQELMARLVARGVITLRPEGDYTAPTLTTVGRDAIMIYETFKRSVGG